MLGQVVRVVGIPSGELGNIRRPSLLSRGRCDQSVALATALERPQNQTAGLHLLNELAETTPGRLATFERSHRLLDDHESAVHDAQTGIVAGVSYKGSLHASNDLQPIAEELCDRIAAGRSTDDLGMFQRAREI